MRILSFLVALELPFLAAREFKLLSYSEIRSRMEQLASAFPESVELFTAQERYGLASPGTCDGTPCQQFILRLSAVSEELQPPEMPEAFVSGALHGDERVGPVASLEAAELLVVGASCAKSGVQAESCGRLSEYNLVDQDLAWFYRLLKTRAIYVMPMTNALGYAQDTRTENNVDPNRDFPYDYKGEGCMHTITARAVNELFREHIFQVALTYHAGMEMIGYEWGSKNHDRPRDISPDDVAQHELATRESEYAGGFANPADGKLVVPYASGKMSQVVYSVNGGMEDWAYAGSWDNGFTPEGANPPQQPCKDWDDYPSSRSTNYEDATLRCFLFLVETSKMKHPDPKSLGQTSQLLSPQGPTVNGHIARNIRLFFMHMDVVQPIVQVLPLEAWNGGWDTEEGAPPIANASGIPMTVANEIGRPIILRAPAQEEQAFTLEWTVWGAFQVDDMEVFAMPWSPSGEAGGQTVCSDTVYNPDDSNISAVARITNAVAQWESVGGAFGHHQRASISLSSLDALFPSESDGTEIVHLGLRATVDANWGDVPEGAVPNNATAQSHIVNARTNPQWDKVLSNNKHRVGGQKWFYSAPIYIAKDAGATHLVLNPCSTSGDGVFSVLLDSSIVDKGQVLLQNGYYLSGLETTSDAPKLNFTVRQASSSAHGTVEESGAQDDAGATDDAGASEDGRVPDDADMPDDSTVEYGESDEYTTSEDSSGPDDSGRSDNSYSETAGDSNVASNPSDDMKGGSEVAPALDVITTIHRAEDFNSPDSSSHVWLAYFFPIVFVGTLACYLLYRKHTMRGTYMSIPTTLGTMSRGSKISSAYSSNHGFDFEMQRNPFSSDYGGRQYGGSAYRGSNFS